MYLYAKKVPFPIKSNPANIFCLTRSWKCFVLILSSFLFFLNASGQHSAIDSLKKELNLATADTTRINILCHLSRESEGEDAYKYALEALGLSEKINFKPGMAQALAYIGKHDYFKENFSNSLKQLTRAYEIAGEIKNYRLLAYICRYIGYNQYLKEPKIALEYYVKSISYSKIANDKLYESYAYSAIGNLYESIQDGQNALGYYLLSLNIREKEGQPDELVSSLIETARAYSRIKQYNKTNQLVVRAIQIAEQKGKDPQNLIYLYQMLGYNYADNLKDYKQALGYFLKSYELVKARSSFYKNNIASIKPIAETYLKMGDYKKSSEYFRLYFELLEANQIKTDKELYNTQFVLEKELEKQKFLLKDAELLNQKMEIQKQAHLRNLFIAGFAILLIIMFFIYRNNRLKHKLNVTLEKTVAERTLQLATTNKHLQAEIEERKVIEEKLIQSEIMLKDTNQELEAFIYKASHDLKGPLTSSRGLVNLASSSKTTEEVMELIGMIKVSLDKLDNILLGLHEIAIIRKGAIILKEINVEAVIKNTIGNFKDYKEFPKINFTVVNQLNRPFTTDELLFQTILRNLIENAIKYSRQNSEPSFVEITINENGPYNIIQIRDNGIGISPEHQHKVFDVFFRATEKSKGSGLGLYIVKNAVTKLNGKIEIISTGEQKGTTFILRFPCNE